MIMKRFGVWSLFVGALVTAALAVALTPVQAQQNLLSDPGFEGPYVGRGRPDLNTPQAWNIWLADSPRNYEWQNRPDRTFAFPHPGGPETHGGSFSQNINGGYVTFTAALFQQVTVPANSDVTASIWARLKTCNLPRGQGGVLVGDTCGSAVEAGSYVRVGIDPTGGTNPASPSIVWSSNITPHDRWEQAAVSARAQGSTVTMFAWVSQQWPSDLNNVWFDDASLTLGISAPGGAAAQPGATAVPPPPTAPPLAAFVRRQPPQPDGSQIHIVQAGDTLAAIAFAYGVTVEEIRELNNLRGTRWILVGQRLLIQPAPPVGLQPAASPSPQPAVGGSTGSTGMTALPTLPAQPFGSVIPTIPPRSP
jgi:hypothetical protein